MNQYFKQASRALLLFTLALFPVAQGQTFVKFRTTTYTMGDATGEGFPNETQHTVTIGTFHLSTTEVPYSDWKVVYTWAIANGYTFDRAGKARSNKHPVHSVSWYDVVKWCNAKSELKGRVPCYRVGAEIYKTGRKYPTCSWQMNGFRLPTEAEWEYAARATLAGNNFPWGDTISHSQANYFSDARFFYDVSPTRGFHPLYIVKNPYTSPVGSFPAVAGLHDMIGNVSEWCWDWMGDYPTNPVTINPRGPSKGSYRVNRGGGWATYAQSARSSFRNITPPSSANNSLGFRLARSF